MIQIYKMKRGKRQEENRKRDRERQGKISERKKKFNNNSNQATNESDEVLCCFYWGNRWNFIIHFNSPQSNNLANNIKMTQVFSFFRLFFFAFSSTYFVFMIFVSTFGYPCNLGEGKAFVKTIEINPNILLNRWCSELIGTFQKIQRNKNGIKKNKW